MGLKVCIVVCMLVIPVSDIAVNKGGFSPLHFHEVDKIATGSSYKKLK